MKYTPIFLFGIGLTAALTAAGCNKAQPTATSITSGQENATTTIVQPTTDDKLAQDTALNNPATVYCLQEGGKFNMKKNLIGNTEGLCTLPDNVTCEVWAFYKGDCPAGRKHAIEAGTASGTQETAKTTPLTAPTSTTVDTTSLEGDASGRPAPTMSSEGKKATLKPEISVKAGDTGEITTSWRTNGLDVQDGFIVMLSGSKDMTYPAKYSQILKNPQSRSFTWTNLVTDRTYYFRVCIAQGAECGAYSDVVSTTAP